MSLLPTFLLLGVMVILYVIMFKRMGGGGGNQMNFGKAKVKSLNDEKKKTTFADVAEDEGFKEVAHMYRSIIVAEQAHERRYLRLLERMENEHTFHRPEPVTWQCRKCGYTFTGRKAPDRCPACLHPKGHFEVKAENY